MANNIGTTDSEKSFDNFHNDCNRARNTNIYVVGAVGNPDAQIVRIVHISDTRDRHDSFIGNIPAGHILIHSGNFSNNRISRHFFPERDIARQTTTINTFFDRLPHDYKVFVPGNHDLHLDCCSPSYVQSLLPSAIYLQDVSCVIYGLKIYGTPWTPVPRTSLARGFSRDWNFVRNNWKNIPDDTDILVSHIPPWHAGMYEDISKRVKPTLHLFGHDYNNYGIKWKDKILFSNAALHFGDESSNKSNGHPQGLRWSAASPTWSSDVQRSPIVVDVYVVSDDFRVEMPNYPKIQDPEDNLPVRSEDAELFKNGSAQVKVVDDVSSDSPTSSCSDDVSPNALCSESNQEGSSHFRNICRNSMSKCSIS